MPEETKNAQPTTVEQVLRDQLVDMQKMLDAQAKQISMADEVIKSAQAAQRDAELRAEGLEKKLKSTKTATPTKDVVVLDGKTWEIKGTVRAQNALEEVKRGHIPGDVTLVVIDRIE